MQSVDKIMAMGGNYLLNVGPRADGTIPDEQIALLRKIGGWFMTVRGSFYDAEPASDLTENQDVLLTRQGDTLYVHCYEDPESSGLILRPLDQLPRRAILLNTGQPLEAKVEITPRLWQEQWNQGRRGAEIKPYLHLRGLPVDDLAGQVIVLELEFDQALR
jgi:alpha-L-fucosidase